MLGALGANRVHQPSIGISSCDLKSAMLCTKKNNHPRPHSTNRGHDPISTSWAQHAPGINQQEWNLLVSTGGIYICICGGGGWVEFGAERVWTDAWSLISVSVPFGNVQWTSSSTDSHHRAQGPGTFHIYCISFYYYLFHYYYYYSLRRISKLQDDLSIVMIIMIMIMRTPEHKAHKLTRQGSRTHSTRHTSTHTH